MPSNYSTFTVSFRGQVDVALKWRQVSDAEQQHPESLVDDLTKALVDELNRDADSLSEEVEAELGRMLPPGISARVQLGFSKGSVVVAGLLTLFVWAMPIVATKALETVTDRALGLALDRVLRRFTSGWSDPPGRGSLSLRGPLSIHTEFSTLPELEESSLPAQSARAAPSVAGLALGGVGATALLVVDTALLMVLVIIEAFRLIRLP
jgi:hypothetical protein